MTHRLTRMLSPLVVACAVLTPPLQAGTIVAGKPEDLGFSTERLARIHEAVQRHIDAKAIAGAVTLVVRNGRIAHFEAHGLIDIESNRPMPKDGHIPARVDVEAGNGSGRDDHARGGKATAHRSGVALHSRVQGDEGGGTQARI